MVMLGGARGQCVRACMHAVGRTIHLGLPSKACNLSEVLLLSKENSAMPHSNRVHSDVIVDTHGSNHALQVSAHYSSASLSL